MKVCFVASKSAGLTGANQSLVNLVGSDAFQAALDMTVVCDSQAGPLNVLLEKGEKATVIPGVVPVWITDFRKRSVSKWIRGFLKWPYCWLHVAQAVRFLKKNEIELVHINSMFCSPVLAYAALRLGIPYVWHIREFINEDLGMSYIWKEEYFRLVRSAQRIVAVSNAVREKWEPVLDRNINVIYNGIPKPQNYIERDDLLDHAEIRLYFAGQIAERKGQMDAVQAVEQLVNEGHKNYTLTIVGYRGIEEYEQYIYAYIKDHRLDRYIKIIDFTYDQAELRKAHDVGLLCSKKEAFGRVTVENMLSGLLMVGTNAGGTKELIKDNDTGLLYEPGDIQGLKEILLRIDAERAEMKDIAKRGQEYAGEHFMIERTAKQILDVYESVQNDPGRICGQTR